MSSYNCTLDQRARAHVTLDDTELNACLTMCNSDPNCTEARFLPDTRRCVLMGADYNAGAMVCKKSGGAPDVWWGE
mgnify:CR=1 FL=1